MRALEDIRNRLLEGTSDVNDYLPASAAFIGAGLIWVVIIICAVVLFAFEKTKELDFTVEGRPGSRRSIFSSHIVSSESGFSETSVLQTALLDARYNFQTLFLALVQASFSMLVLGGVQLNFELTCFIVLMVVCVWTFFIGIFMTFWMSFVADDQVNDTIYTSNRSLRDLTQELRGSSRLLFVRHFVEVSILKPMCDMHEISAHDIYQDIGREGSRTFLLGLGQIILLCMYTWSIMDDGKPDLSNARIYQFYCWGIVMQIAYLSGQDVVLKSFTNHMTFWGNVFCASRKGYAYTWEPAKYLLYHRPRITMSGSVSRFNNEACVRLKHTPFLWFRFLLSTIVNVGGLSIITLLLPLQLSADGDPLKFVLSAVGAYYILGIDDYSDPVKYSLVIENDEPGIMEMTSMGGPQGGHGNDLEIGNPPPDDFRYSSYMSY
eukprot:CAMPEP_0198303538 /NCGR_PEP_ID=MMETSP1449-20131203/56936_1 /TAXON_ID=420275 /ORGANISM="Attheya septentrionalis, Strain CCMP2084" /LENGTH=433 /DNA_ID=CAMNT_0044006033 /DNA_START=67 /DNA_END=1368 /DNA_ORIENTATION=+